MNQTYVLGRRSNQPGIIRFFEAPIVYDNKEAATGEAERLAKIYPGVEFYVFKALSKSAIPTVSTVVLP